jgi:hypothetical protein
VVQREAVQFGVHVAGVEQRTNRRRESQPTVGFGQVQRFDAQPVTSERDDTCVAIGDREREHALEAAHATGAPSVKGLDNDLAVGSRKKLVSNSFELFAQFLVVVDAAVEHQGQPEVAVDHRLPATRGQVDDRQAPVAERERTVRDDAVGIGAAGRHGTRHPGHRGHIGRLSVEADFSADTAHVAFRSLRRRLVVSATSQDPGVLAAAARR